MTQVSMNRQTLHFVVSEANGYQSRDVVNIDNSAGTDPIVAGTIIPEGVLAQEVAAGETVDRTVMARNCEVSGEHLTYAAPGGAAEIAAGNAALLALGIIVR